jgi:hypothetical protein
MAQGTTRSGVCAYGMALQRGLSEAANLLRDTWEASFASGSASWTGS